MQKLKKVNVIMSTYNGEKFLKEQIDSILKQKDVEVYLNIFDDLSTDNTVAIISEYEEKYKNIKLHINEKNKNFTYNFLDALFSFKDNQDFDFFAFADQDDVWIEDKLITAIKHIESVGSCTLYCSNAKVVDKDLNYDNINMWNLDYKFSHNDIYYANFAMGCTIVMDNDFKNLATKFYPKNIYLHDYWLALIANCCRDAHFILDINPNHLLYRQHGNNQIGKSKSSKLKMLKKLLFSKKIYYKSKQNLMKHLFELYKDFLNEKDRIFVEKSANVNKFSNRLYLITHLKTFFPLRYKLLVLFNKY